MPYCGFPKGPWWPRSQRLSGSGMSTRGADAADADRIAQLERLAKLRKSGALTEAEFQAEKARVLGEL